MSTNYYFESCSERLHIGKASTGWVFSLHVIPELNIRSLEDWQKIWVKGGQILNEYNEPVTVDHMLRIITKRSRSIGLRKWDRVNHLSRFIEPDEPTYDLVEGDFS